jgi:hypothetical protein
VGARIFVLGGGNGSAAFDTVHTFDTRQIVWEKHNTTLPMPVYHHACEYMELKNGKKVIILVSSDMVTYLDMAAEAAGWQTDIPGLTDPNPWWEWRDIANIGRSVAYLNIYVIICIMKIEFPWL